MVVFASMPPPAGLELVPIPALLLLIPAGVLFVLAAVDLVSRGEAVHAGWHLGSLGSGVVVFTIWDWRDLTWVPSDPLSGLWRDVHLAGELCAVLAASCLLAVLALSIPRALQPGGDARWSGWRLGLGLAGLTVFGPGAIRAILGADLRNRHTVFPMLAAAAAVWALPWLARVGTARLDAGRRAVAGWALAAAGWTTLGLVLAWLWSPLDHHHALLRALPSAAVALGTSLLLGVVALPGTGLRLQGLLGHGVVGAATIGLLAASYRVMDPELQVPLAVDLVGAPMNRGPPAEPWFSPCIRELGDVPCPGCGPCLWALAPDGERWPTVDLRRLLLERPGTELWPDVLRFTVEPRFQRGNPDAGHHALVRVSPVDDGARAEVSVQQTRPDGDAVGQRYEVGFGRPLHALLGDVVDGEVVLLPGWSVQQEVSICASALASAVDVSCRTEP